VVDFPGWRIVDLGIFDHWPESKPTGQRSPGKACGMSNIYVIANLTSQCLSHLGSPPPAAFDESAANAGAPKSRSLVNANCIVDTRTSGCYHRRFDEKDP